MKNKIFIRSLLVTFFAFMLYSASMKRNETATVKVIEPKIQRKAKAPSKKQHEPKAPKIETAEFNRKVSIVKGSQTDLATAITKAMGSNDSYQVVVQDLNNSKRFAKVANSNRVHKVDQIMRFFILLALYREEQKGKLRASTVVKISKADHAKNDQMLQVNIQYGLAYLRQAMMQGSKTAANALLRTIGSKQVAQIIQATGAKQTSLKGKFTANTVGETTAEDLNKAVLALYQGQVVKKEYAYRVLAAMHNPKIKVTSKLSGTIYGIGDSNAEIAIVQTNGKSYAISVWSNTNTKFAKLGEAVNKWFAK